MIKIIDLTKSNYHLRPSSSTPGAWTIDFTKNDKKFSTRFNNLNLAYASLQQKNPDVFPVHLSQAILIRNSSQKDHYTVMYYNFQTQQDAQMRCDSLPAAKNFAQQYAHKINTLINSKLQTQQQTGFSIFEQFYGVSQQTVFKQSKWQEDEATFQQDVHQLLTTQNYSTSQRLR